MYIIYYDRNYIILSMVDENNYYKNPPNFPVSVYFLNFSILTLQISSPRDPPDLHII